MYVHSLISEIICIVLFFFKQKTAYEMRISDWSSDVCSSDLNNVHEQDQPGDHRDQRPDRTIMTDQEERNAGEDKILVRHERQARHEQLQCGEDEQIGRASCRERVGQYV